MTHSSQNRFHQISEGSKKFEYRRQDFSIPLPVITYMKETPSSSKGYEKLIKSCKYFGRNPILVMRYLYFFDTDKWSYCTQKYCNHDYCNVFRRMKKTIPNKVWVTKHFCTLQNKKNFPKVASSIVPQLYNYQPIYVTIENQSLSFDEFRFLTLPAETLFMSVVTVINEDGKHAPFDEIIFNLPNVQFFSYYFDSDAPNVSRNTAENLAKADCLKNKKKLLLRDIPENFIIQTFFHYIKNNTKTAVSLDFARNSVNYREEVAKIVQEIKETKNHAYRLPSIHFPVIENYPEIQMNEMVLNL